MARNLKKEAVYEDRPEQVKRREARNRARSKTNASGATSKGDGKEVDHLGYHRTGSLDNVKTKVVSKSTNRKRQPPTKARGTARK